MGDNLNANILGNTTSYIVKTGDSLYTIAKKYNTTVDELMEINHLSGTMIYPNQVLFIPKAQTSTTDTYLTKAGDTISSILDKYGIDFATFLKYNDIDRLQLLGNQLVKVSPSDRSNTMTLRGESVDDVLAKYQTSPYELLKLNESQWFSQNQKIIIR